MIAGLMSRARPFAGLLAIAASVTPARAVDGTWNMVRRNRTGWRARLLAGTALALLLANALPAAAVDATWKDPAIVPGLVPGTFDFNNDFNWTSNVHPDGTAFFGTSITNDLSFSSLNTTIGGWTFNAGASAYTFTIVSGQVLQFVGAGIAINGGSATITNDGFLNFFSGSAGSATITTNNGALTTFSGGSGGTARLIANGTGAVDFSQLLSAGTTAGSFEGSGNFFLGSKTITVGGNNLSTEVSGVIQDGGIFGGVGGALVKEGSGTLTLSGTNTYTGGTTISAGTLQLGDGGTSGSIVGDVVDNGVFAINRSDSYTFAGAISGTGAFQQLGAGTTVLTGANTYTGGTTVNAGTLQAGAVNTFSPSSAFTVAAGASLNLASFNQTVGSLAGAGSVTLGSATLTTGNDNTSTTFSGAISGSGGLTKIGSGIFVLTGSNTYSGATAVNAGTLFVNGSIANSAVTVNSGATLAGIGTVGPTTINSGGSFAPGTSPGTITVQGNLAFQSGAIYLVQVNPSTASSTNVTAGGSATLAGTVQAAFASGSYVSRTYTILSAAGGLNGTTFNNLTTTNLPAGFTPSLSYTATSAILNLTATLGQPSAPGAPGVPSGPNALGIGALSFNQFNVANSLNNFFNSGGTLPSTFVGIFGLTGANLASALSQLSGEAATGAQKVGFQLTDQFLNLMLDPFVDGRSGVGGADHPALGFAPEREALPEDIALAYSKVLKAPPKPVPVYEPRWTVWGGAYGGSNRTTGDLANIGSHDLSARTVGFAGGFDYRLTPDTVVGLAFAGGGTDWSLAQGLGGGKSDAFQAGLYGATKSGPAYLAAAFAFANHWMSTDRFAFGDHLTADFNAQSYGGRLEGGYRFGTPYGGITPYAAIQAQNFHTPGYTESGLIPNGFALAFNGRDATDTRSELGARFDRVLALYTNAVLALRGRVAWAHDWVSDPTLTPLFQTLPGASFIVNGATPAQDSALVSAGGELRLANGVTLLAKFDGEFASNSSTYSGTGTIRYRW
jgi:autotransporter-associated beta strand protein